MCQVKYSASFLFTTLCVLFAREPKVEQQQLRPPPPCVTSYDVSGHLVMSWGIMWYHMTSCPNLAHSEVAATIHGQYQPWPPVAATIHRHYQPRPTVAATIHGQYQPRPPVGATIHGQYQPQLCSGSYNTWSISTSTSSSSYNTWSISTSTLQWQQQYMVNINLDLQWQLQYMVNINLDFAVTATIHGQYQPRLCSGSYNTWSI